MKHYRVVTNGRLYRLQYQRTWWPDWCWRFVRVGQDGVGYDEHESLELAVARLRSIRTRKRRDVWVEA